MRRIPLCHPRGLLWWPSLPHLPWPVRCQWLQPLAQGTSRRMAIKLEVDWEGSEMLWQVWEWGLLPFCVSVSWK